MRNYFFIFLFLTTSKNAILQEEKSKLFFIGGIQVSDIKLKSENNEDGNLSTNTSSNPRLEIGYEHYLTKKSSLAVRIGYSSLTKYFMFDLSQNYRDSLQKEGLSWNDHIRIPRNQRYLNVDLGYVFHHIEKEKFRLSYLINGRFRYALVKDFFSYSASSLFYENPDNVFQTNGPLSYELFPSYNLFSFNPTVSIRYEKFTKYGNSFGFTIDFCVPLTISYSGRLEILPEMPELNSSFEYYSRGGFVGLTCFYGIGFGKSN